MASLTAVQSPVSVTGPGFYSKTTKALKPQNTVHGLTIPRTRISHTSIRCTNLSPWEPSPATFSPTDDVPSNLVKKASNIFDTLESKDSTAEEARVVFMEDQKDPTKQPSAQLQLLKWPLWIMGPSLLLITGMVPTLWLPISSIFLGPSIASLLSLVGLDCIFNLGATLFLLMADACARPKNPSLNCVSEAPVSYQIWNMVGNFVGFIIPLAMFFIAQNGSVSLQLQTQFPFISFAVLLGPYLLLLSVQILTEMLTWHWKSPVWLLTPVIYETYRILQLMRGLKLGVELSAPAWMVHTVRGLVCWWVLVLGMQLMRVAWFAGFTARASEKDGSAEANGFI